MGISLGEFFIRWFVTAVAVFVAAAVVPGITYSSFTGLAFAALLLGIINAMVRPVLLILCLPLILVTMGLFILVLNALLLWLVSGILPGSSFHVDGFWSAFWGAIVIGLVSWLLSSFFRGSDGKIYPLTHHPAITGSLDTISPHVVKCPTCSSDVSSQAFACPNCGQPLNRSNDPAEKTYQRVKWFTVSIGIIIFIFLLRGCPAVGMSALN